MRAAIYVRNSTDEQHNSPERQLSQIRPYCQSKGYQVVKEYQDVAMKGYDDSRPQFQKLIADAGAGLFDVVVVDEQSRLTRNNPVEYFAKVVHPLMEANVCLDTVAKGMRDWDDLAGVILQTVDQHQSNTEVVTLSRRVATELARKALAGHAFLNKPPYGYKKVWVKEATGEVVHEGNRAWVGRPPQGVVPRLEVRDDEAQIVRWIFDCYLAQDMSLMGIMKELHRRGVLTPLGKAHWSRTYIHNILTNPVYVGDYVFNRRSRGRFHSMKFVGEDKSPRVVAKKAKGGVLKETDNSPEDWVVIADSHPPLVSRDAFVKVQAMLKDNLERRTPGTARDDYPLSHILVCGRCQSHMAGDRVPLNKKRPSAGEKFYICAGYLNHGPAHCNPHRATEDTILPVLVRIVSAHLLEPENLQALRTACGTTRTDECEPAQRLRRKLKELDKSIKQATANLSRLDAEFLGGVQKEIRQWKAERDVAHKELIALTKPVPAADLANRIEDAIRSLGEDLKVLPPAPLRVAIRSSVAKVVLAYETEQKAVRKRHHLRSGTVYFRNGTEVEFRPTEQER